MAGVTVMSNMRTKDGYDIVVLPNAQGKIQIGIDDVFTQLTSSETDKLINIIKQAKKESMSR